MSPGWVDLSIPNNHPTFFPFLFFQTQQPELAFREPTQGWPALRVPEQRPESKSDRRFHWQSPLSSLGITIRKSNPIQAKRKCQSSQTLLPGIVPWIVTGCCVSLPGKELTGHSQSHHSSFVVVLSLCLLFCPSPCTTAGVSLWRGTKGNKHTDNQAWRGASHEKCTIAFDGCLMWVCLVPLVNQKWIDQSDGAARQSGPEKEMWERGGARRILKPFTRLRLSHPSHPS